MFSFFFLKKIEVAFLVLILRIFHFRIVSRKMACIVTEVISATKSIREMVYHCVHSYLCTFALKMRECFGATATVLRCDGEVARVRKRDNESRRCHGESAKVRRQRSNFFLVMNYFQETLHVFGVVKQCSAYHL